MSRRVHAHDLFKEALEYGLASLVVSTGLPVGLDSESLDDKESNVSSTLVFFNERNSTLHLTIGGHSITLHEGEAWDLLDAIERELSHASLVADHKGD